MKIVTTMYTALLVKRSKIFATLAPIVLVSLPSSSMGVYIRASISKIIHLFIFDYILIVWIPIEDNGNQQKITRLRIAFLFVMIVTASAARQSILSSGTKYGDPLYFPSSSSSSLRDKGKIQAILYIIMLNK